MSRMSDVQPQGLGPSRVGAVGVRYRRADGAFVDTTLDRLDFDRVIAGLPMREFRSYRGRKHYSGFPGGRWGCGGLWL